MKVDKEVIYSTSENKYLSRKPDKKLGKTGCNRIALCKTGVFQMKSQEVFHSSRFY